MYGHISVQVSDFLRVAKLGPRDLKKFQRIITEEEIMPNLKDLEGACSVVLEQSKVLPILKEITDYWKRHDKKRSFQPEESSYSESVSFASAEEANKKDPVIEDISFSSLEEEPIKINPEVIKIAKVYTRMLGHVDEAEKQRLLMSLYNFERATAHYFKPSGDFVRITDRIEDLGFPECDLEDLKEIGKDASDRYEDIYGVKPFKVAAMVGKEVKMINAFPRDRCKRTVDAAIKDFFQ